METKYPNSYSILKNTKFQESETGLILKLVLNTKKFSRVITRPQINQ